jgi:hypothetical protein
MRSLRTLTVLTSLAVGSVSSAFAGAGVVDTVVTRLQDAVTYSKAPLTTYVAYQVQVSNAGGNTVNNIRFTAKSVATGGVGPALYSSAEGGSCQPAADPTEVTCTIGQLTATTPALPITLFFVAPANDTADPPVPDFVTLTGTTFYGEGTGGAGSPPDNSIKEWVTPYATVLPVALGTNNPTLVKSAVPKSGGQFFTGDAVATGGDKWTTTVVVPATTSFTTAEIAETMGLPLAANLLDSRITTLSIPGAFAKLVITLRRDASTIVKGAKIGSAKVYYGDPSVPDPRIDYANFQVPSCADTTYGVLPQPGIPCINRRTEYTKKTAPAPDWEGDWEFEVFALDNGRYVN